MGMIENPMPLKDRFSQARQEIKSIATGVLNLKTIITSETLPTEADQGEMIANVMLAYRHLEDAAMRLGKTIQAHDGGKSVYDK